MGTKSLSEASCGPMGDTMSEGLKEFDTTLLKGVHTEPVPEPMANTKCHICGKRMQVPEWMLDMGEPLVCSNKCAWEMSH